MQEPLLKEQNSFPKEEGNENSTDLLPPQSVIIKDHNFFFLGLSKLISEVRDLSKLGKQVQNEQVNKFITKTTQLEPCVIKLQEYISKNSQSNRNASLNSKSNSYQFQYQVSLAKILWYMTREQLLIGLTLSITQNGLGCGAIFVLDLITDQLKVKETRDENKLKLCLMMIGIVVLYFLKNVLFSQYTWCQAKWKSQCRTTLQYVAFTKQLRTKIYTPPQKGEQQKNVSATLQVGEKNKSKKQHEKGPDINNIMTVDVNQCLSLYWSLIETISSLITLSIVLVLIYYKIGSAILSGIYVLIGSFFINLVLTLSMSYLYSKQYKMKDKRVILTKDVLDGIKSIKYLGWESVFQKKLERTRSGEYKCIMSTRCLDGIISVFWNSISYFLLFFFLADYINNGNQLADSNVFTIIALFGYLTYPMGILPWSIGYLVKIRVSFLRISQFLKEREINEELQNGDRFSIQENRQDGQSEQDCAIHIKNTKFVWPSKQIEEVTQDINKNGNKSNKRSLQEYSLQQCNDFIEENKDDFPQQFELNIENLYIQKGSFTVVVGRTGCGKSALLYAILREMDKIFFENNDKVSISMVSSPSEIDAQKNLTQQKLPFYYLDGKVAYVAQNHWLQNKSVKDNILFGNEFNKRWYETCLKVCELKEDLESFTEGDQKSVGPNGSNLSGGQKQRVALCRAIYLDADIYLLDDIFSSLDTHVAKRIYINSIQKLLIEKKQKTVIMVTSHFEVLKSIKLATSQMLLVDRGQLIKDESIIEQFMKTSSCFNIPIIKQNMLTRNHSQSIEDIDFKQMKIDKSFETLSRSSSFSSSVLQKDDIELVKEQSKPIIENKINEEVREQSTIKLQTIHSYFNSMGYIFLILFLMFNFLMQGSQMLIDFWLRDYTKQESQFFLEINTIFDTFTKAFFFFVLLNVGFTALRSLFYCICALLSSRRIFLKLNKCIIFSKMKFFDSNPVGRILSRLSDDVDSVDYYLPWQCQTFMEQLAYSIGYPVGIAIQFPWIVVIIFVCFGFIYYVQRQFRDSNREIKRLNSVNTGKVLNVVSECSKGVVTIRAFQNQNYILKDFFLKLNDSVNTFAVSQGVQVWMMIRLLTISNLVFAFVSISSIVIILCDFHFNYTTIAMCLTYSILLSTRFSDLMQYFSNVEQYFISVERICQYFSNEQEMPKNIIGEGYFNNHDQMFESKDKMIEELSKQKSPAEIEFKDVYLSYDEQKSTQIFTESDQEQFLLGSTGFALKGISFQIQKGEKVAFCGRTGSGKSSILNLLFGMYPFQKGDIYVQGKNLKILTLQDLRQQMAIIPQFGFLFKSTLRDNLDPTQKLSDNQIHTKIVNSGISLESIQFKEPQNNSSVTSENQTKYQLQLQQEANLDSLIQQGGANLSNGQSQIINFLRIILKETDIICLDEATSNMDPITDSLLSQALFQFSKNKTLIVITHRLENIDRFDKVIVMEGGKIAECGHVIELRKIEDGFFNRLSQNKSQQ